MNHSIITKINRVLFLLFVALFMGANGLFAQSVNTYEYDNLNRLTKTTYANGTVVQYTYDAVGNRLTKTVNGTSVSCTITATANPSNGGTVSGGGIYQSGATCTLIATANANYTFDHWTKNGATISGGATITFTVTESAAYVAYFIISQGQTYTIAVTANPSNGGTVSGGGSYQQGQTCSVTATANSGYTFTNWTENGTQVSTNATYSFSVSGNRTLVANFTEAGGDGYHWNVNVYDYPTTMTIVGIIHINGVEQMTNALEIGAFCGNECRGRERLTDQYYPVFNHYFVFLTIYGVDGNTISFRLYDHSAGEELGMSCASISFVTNATFGNAGAPYVFDFSQGIVTQTANFASGWNWWSSYVESEDLINQLKTGLGANGQQIKSQTQFTQYNSSVNMWIGQLNTINNESTYMIQSTACSVEMTGLEARPENHPITLNHGWNWIGYPSGTTLPITSAFSGITPMGGDQVKSQNGFSQYNGTMNMWIGNLNNIAPGMGLMYQSNSNQVITLVYPAGSRDVEPSENVTNAHNHWTNDVHAYPNNMTVTAVVELDGEELQSESYEIAAFASGECRGSARLLYVEPLNRYMAFLIIAGDEASELHFSLYDAESGNVETVCTPSLQYETNAIVGNVEEPCVISFRGVTGIDEFDSRINVFPNPVAKGEIINIGLPVVEMVRAPSIQVEIINALGQVVETVCTPSVQTITAPSVAGAYTLRITIEGKGTYYRKLVVR